MDLKLTGKRALVTGSTSGIGAEIARMLAFEGVGVIVHGRDPDRAERVVAEIGANGGRAAIALGDLRTDEGLEAVIVATETAYGGVDILVNNAGGPDASAFQGWFETPFEEWPDRYLSNVMPSVRLAHAFVPGMRRRGWGRVIRISSTNAIAANSQLAPYGAAKAAMNHLTLSLSKALAGTGVTFNGILPGLIDTPLAEPWFRAIAKQLGSDDPDVGKEVALNSVLQQSVARIGQPKDVAAAVCFIASPLADFITGAVLRIDGGAASTI